MLLTLLLVPLSTFRLAEILVTWERNLRRSWNDPSFSANRNIGIVALLSSSYVVDTTWLPFLLPILGFIILYSFLGHKEMRFIFPVLPILNLVAAVGMSKLNRLSSFASHDVTKKDDSRHAQSVSWIARLGFGCGLFCMLVTLGCSLTFVAVSRWNYPGGDALISLVRHVQQQQQQAQQPNVVVMDATTIMTPTIRVHVDVASAMSGVSLFGQRAAQESVPGAKWEFVKDGYEMDRTVDANGWIAFTHVLTEEPSKMESYGFQKIQTVPGRPILSLRERTIVTVDTIFVMERAESLEQRGT
jgi:alpha-1,6-mannosyltransferase